MRVALTYDDGPHDITEGLLDVLAEHGAKATFFVCGHAIAGREETLLRMKRDGHLIGNHSFNHPRLTALNILEVIDELDQTSLLIEEVTQEWPTVWRAPYGDTSEQINVEARRFGMKHTGWTIDPADWRQRDPAKIAADTLDWFTDGAIVDLHDGFPPDGGSGTNTRAPTLEATWVILQQVKFDVQWVTVADLV